MIESTTRSHFTAILEDNGYRLTLPRREIIAALEVKHEGFTAEEIVTELPQLGRATVYRTLKLLLEVGAICRLNMMNGAPRYSPSRVEHHHHAVCVQCGSVSEFRAATLERFLRALGTEIPGVIVGHRIDLYITCPLCIRDASDKPVARVHGHGHTHSHGHDDSYAELVGS
jgi:Fe2+ or Zn2+ uptake regulation protein